MTQSKFCVLMAQSQDGLDTQTRANWAAMAVEWHYAEKGEPTVEVVHPNAKIGWYHRAIRYANEHRGVSLLDAMLHEEEGVRTDAPRL